MPETTAKTKSKSPYVEIALTYFRRKMFWLSGAYLLLMIGLLVQGGFGSKHPHDPVPVPITRISPLPPSPTTTSPIIIDPATLAMLAKSDQQVNERIIAQNTQYVIESRTNTEAAMIRMFFLFLAWILVTILIHLKQQIASPHAVLSPNYRRPHILVAAAFALPLLFLLPLGISAAYSLPPLAVLAVTTLFSALILWSAYLPKWPLLIILATLWLGSYTTPGQRAIYAAVANTAILPNLLLLTFALAALVALTHRLMLLREEMPEYSRQIQTNQWQTMTMPQSPQFPLPQINYHNPLNRLFYAAAHRELARLAVSPPTSLWSRLQRWRLAGNPVSFTLILLPILLLILFITMPLKGSADMQFWSMELILLPGLVFPQFALAAWRTLGIESLRPLSRAAYFHERAAFFALEIAKIWFILAAALLACTAFLQPESLRNPTLWLALAISALAQFPILAIYIWVLRYRSPFAIIISIGLSIGLASAAITICTEPHLALPLPWLAAIIISTLLASALLLRDAYHRWLRTDLA